MHGINVINDSGSDILAFFYADLECSRNLQFYEGWTGRMDFGAAGGQVEHLYTVSVELRFTQPMILIPWGPWFPEQAVLRDLVPGIDRLSGAGMRDHYFFGTRLDNVILGSTLTQRSSNTYSILEHSTLGHFNSSTLTCGLSRISSVKTCSHLTIYIIQSAKTSF